MWCGAAMVWLGGICSGAEAWIVYHAPEADVSALREKVQSIVPEAVRVDFCVLPKNCKTLRELDVQRAALDAGVCVLPSLVLRDERGAYAALPLEKLTAKGVQSATALADSPQRQQISRTRQLTANIYYYTACARLPFIPPQEQLAAIRVLQELAKSELLPIQQRQFIALHCIYPALMEYYTRSYQGAHTPATEHLFLQAIEALEYARDLDPRSTLGRRAYDRRETLRAARLKAKKLD